RLAQRHATDRPRRREAEPRLHVCPGRRDGDNRCRRCSFGLRPRLQRRGREAIFAARAARDPRTPTRRNTTPRARTAAPWRASVALGRPYGGDARSRLLVRCELRRGAPEDSGLRRRLTGRPGVDETTPAVDCQASRRAAEAASRSRSLAAPPSSLATHRLKSWRERAIVAGARLIGRSARIDGQPVARVFSPSP